MLRLVIVSPSGELSRTTAAKVSFPGEAGAFTVLPGHAPTAQQYNRHNGFSPCYVPLALCEQGDKGAGLHPCSGFLRPTSEADTGPLHFR